jgi:hypothetical protein
MEFLTKTALILRSLNDSCKSKIFNDEELSELDSNVEDFQKLLFELEKLLSVFEDTKNQSVDHQVENLIHLHLKYSDVIWHYDQVHEMIKKMAGNYGDSIS